MYSLLLVLTALIWGAAFLAQKLGSDHLGPYAFTAARSLLGGLALLAVLALRRGARPSREARARAVRAGILAGAALFVATVFQQVGIAYTTPGVSGFLTATYVLLVPVLGWFVGHRPGRYIWPGVAVALAGLYLICVSGPLRIGKGETLTLVCAVCFAVQILTVAHFAPHVDVLTMSCAEFFTGAALGLPFLLLPSERAMLSWESFRLALPSVAYCGVFSSGVAYTLQNVAQGKVAPAVASILMSLESVFALLFGWWWLDYTQTPRQLAGCGLVFAAVVFTQAMDGRR